MTETVSGPKKIVLLFAFACLLLTGASAMYYRGQAGAKVQVKRGGKMPATMMGGEGQIMDMMQQLQKNPLDIALLTKLGQTFMSMKAWERSVAFWQRIVAIPGQEDNIMALTQLGNCFFELKRFELAAQTFERIVAVHQHSAPSFFNLGLLYKYHLGQEEKAKAAFSRVVELKPKKPGLMQNAQKELDSLP